jgi:indoleamine 2,3-dioxygenase
MELARDPKTFWTVDEEIGMLPAAAARLDRLAGGHPLARMEELASALPHTPTKVLAQALSSREVAEWRAPLDPPAHEAALRTFAFLAARCIHDGLDADRVLPRVLALPLLSLAQQSGRPAGLTYASYVLANCAATPQRRTSPDDILVLRTFSGTADEAWFIAVHLAVESIGPEIVAALDGCAAAHGGPELVAYLATIEDALHWATHALSRIRDGINPEVFRARIRPNLHGFSKVKFGDVSGPVVSYVGETGAQSGLIQSLDCLLCVRHSRTMDRALLRFRQCAPPPHRATVDRAVSIGKEVSSAARVDTQVRKAYVGALDALFEFRRLHASIVEDYLLGGVKGTGGTSGHGWLRALSDDVRRTSEAVST